MLAFLLGCVVFFVGGIACISYLGTSLAGLLGVLVCFFVAYSIAK